MELKKKICAIVSTIAEEICDHSHAYWNGKVPCTGSLVCSMCGSKFSNYTELDNARLLVKSVLKQQSKFGDI